MAIIRAAGQRLRRDAGKLLASEARAAGKAAGGPDFVYRGRFRSSGKFLFVPHPDCCPKCNLLGLTPHFFNTPDVAFISHPNCKCATVEAPAGLSPSQLMEWARNPTGTMRFGFNYGVPLATANLTDRNRANSMLAFANRMRPYANAADMRRRRVRAEVSAAQVERVRRRVAEGTLGPARDYTRGVKTLATKEAKRRAAETSQARRKDGGTSAESARGRARKNWKSRH